MAQRAQRVGLAVLMTLAALNVWTGGPLLALSMAAVFTAAGSLAAIRRGLAAASGPFRLGRPPARRRASPAPA